MRVRRRLDTCTWTGRQHRRGRSCRTLPGGASSVLKTNSDAGEGSG